MTLRAILENFILLLIALLLIGGDYVAAIIYRTTGVLLPIFSLFSIIATPVFKHFFPLGGLEGLALLPIAFMILISLLVSLIVYLIGFIKRGFISREGMAGKIKYFLPWFIYLLGLGSMPYFLFLGYLGVPEDITLLYLPLLFLTVWFLVTWRIGKKVIKV